VTLENSIREIRTAYDELTNRLESYVKNEIIGQDLSFEEYKINLQNRYIKLKRHMLLPNQKSFIQRLDSQIEDRKAWLNSLVQGLINRSLEKIDDADEEIIYDSLKDMIITLDGLTRISKSDFKEENEDVFEMQISSFIDGISKTLIRLPKSKKSKVDNTMIELKQKLGNDKSVNIAALTNLIKEIIKK
jgi:hypothetical protein